MLPAGALYGLVHWYRVSFTAILSATLSATLVMFPATFPDTYGDKLDSCRILYFLRIQKKCPALCTRAQGLHINFRRVDPNVHVPISMVFTYLAQDGPYVYVQYQANNNALRPGALCHLVKLLLVEVFGRERSYEYAVGRGNQYSCS